MNPAEENSSDSLPPVTGGPGGWVFLGMRILFLACFLIVGLLGPAVLVVAGLGSGNPAPVVFGTLVLALVFVLGSMIYAGQRKVRGMMQRLAGKTGLVLSETPDVVPGLGHLSVAGWIRGRWVGLAFENLPTPGTTEYHAGGGKWYVRRARQHLVASVRLAPKSGWEKGEWIDLDAPVRVGGGEGRLSNENVAWLRERGCQKILVGGGRGAMAWDPVMTVEGLDHVVAGIHLLVEFVDRLETGPKSGANDPVACPICGATMAFNPRYPRAVCADCVRRACDEEGWELDFFNADFGGGYLAVYREGGGSYHSHLCFIDGRPCRADEARFGGIVVQISNATNPL